MSGWVHDDDFRDPWEFPNLIHGSVTLLPEVVERDTVEELRQVVAKVTRKPYQAPTKHKIGFY